MARFTFSNALFSLVVISAFAVLASGQGGEMAPAPTPTMDKGSAVNFPVAGTLLGCSLVFSMLGLLKR